MSVPGPSVAARVIRRRPAVTIVVATGALVACGVFLHRLGSISGSWPMDFDLNWVAGRRLLHGEALYNRVASRVEGVELVGPAMSSTGSSPYRSFIGSPFVALQHSPFALVPRDLAVSLFRLLSIVAFGLGIWCTSRTLPRPTRRLGVAVGVIALAVSYPTIQSLSLGQGNGLVVLALGAGLWGLGTGRWTVAGIALGLAAGLKLPLVVIVLYVIVRGERRVAVPALGSFAGGLAIAALAGRPSDLATWFSDVLPGASQGSLYVGNQSAIAWLGRMLSTNPHVDLQSPLGGINRLGLVLLVVALVALARTCRNRAFLLQEVGVVLLVVLVAVPLSWDHYFSWSVVSLVLLCHEALWRSVRPAMAVLAGALVLAAAWLLSQPIAVPTASEVARDWTLRLWSGPYAVATLLIVVVMWLLTARADRSAVAQGAEGGGEHPFAQGVGSSTMAGLWRTRSSSGAPGNTTSATSTSSSRATG